MSSYPIIIAVLHHIDSLRYTDTMSLDESPLVTQTRHRDYLESAVRHLEEFKSYRKALVTRGSRVTLTNCFTQHYPRSISLRNPCDTPRVRSERFLDPTSVQRRF